MERKMSAPLTVSAIPYLRFLDQWLSGLGTVTCDPSTTAILVIDVIEGFCEHGNLASERVNGMVEPVASLLDAYLRHGGVQVLLAEDAHPPEAREFHSFPAHCLAGTDEARTVHAVASLEAPGWRHFPKQTINGMAEPALAGAVVSLLEHGTRDFVVVGDCTDLCIYQAAMAVQLLLNRADYASYSQARVIVPATAVATYDLDVDTAAAVAAQPHPGDTLHAVFLHHLSLNGVVVTATVDWQDRR